MEALHNVIEAQNQLQKASSAYFYASVALKSTVLSADSVSRVTQGELDGLLRNARSQFESIETVLLKLLASHCTLNALLNASTSHTPIHKLPPDTLGYIFEIAVATSSCGHKQDERDALLDISQVCTRWYQTIISHRHRSLWAHIDLHFGIYSNVPTVSVLHRAKLSIERSRGLPLYIHLRQRGAIIKPEQLKELLSILRPHRGLIKSLEMHLESDTPLSQAFVATCSGNQKSALERLVISNSPSISWPATFSSGLVNLELKQTSITLDALAGLLSSCAKLHTLRLVRLEVLLSSERNPSQSDISLLSLRTLEIDGLRGNGIGELISGLHTGNLDLSLQFNLRLSQINQFQPQVQEFLQRSRITSLFITDVLSESSRSVLSWYMLSLPHLRAFHIRSPARGELYMLSHLTIQRIAQLSSLEHLSIFDDKIRKRTLDAIKRIVETKRLKKLVFLNCRFQESYGKEDDPHFPRHRAIPADIKQWLCERAESVVVLDLPPPKHSDDNNSQEHWTQYCSCTSL